jgi:hypothetical protein
LGFRDLDELLNVPAEDDQEMHEHQKKPDEEKDLDPAGIEPAQQRTIFRVLNRPFHKRIGDGQKDAENKNREGHEEKLIESHAFGFVMEYLSVEHVNGDVTFLTGRNRDGREHEKHKNVKSQIVEPHDLIMEDVAIDHGGADEQRRDGHRNETEGHLHRFNGIQYRLKEFLHCEDPPPYQPDGFLNPRN